MTTLFLLTLVGFEGGYYGNHFVCLFVSSLLICVLAPWSLARGGVLHDTSLSSVAREESRMAKDESRMARD